MRTSTHIVAVAIALLTFPFGIDEGEAADQGSSVAIISSVNGEARIAHPSRAQQPDQPKFRGPIIYGDHLSTGKDATLGLLVGQHSLLTMRELSEVRIAETVRNQQILELAKGKVCLAVSRSGDVGAGLFTVKTPTSVITAAAGTLLSVEVEPVPRKSRVQEEKTGRIILTAAGTQPSKEASAPVVETYQVVEGSVDIVSQASGSSLVSLRAGQSLRIVGGVRGQPSVAPPVNCRAQDLQIIPVHTAPPPPAQQMIVQQQMQIASAEPAAVETHTPASHAGTVAAMSSSSGATTSSSGGTIPTNIHIPITNIPDNDLVQTTQTTIQVTLP